ncbi:hypothetical protein AWK44_07885 [Listeria monocytogenes]|uniref:hypothetical protein n=1 Tax=Listeria monocytogenes TaxID=1639 RepID=UPI000BDFC926|nr:hypothetical protein [Listeria monocytogenes]EAE2723031.1 hypothetical protein [Listeria monocytogenes]EAE2738791.1 hypothetical protein [Listeria monocytogenes]PDD93480.1 hypothetical protein AWK44_07885 [Listeria monocytogenes]PDE43904.1 hypothetical protein AWK82_11550 [Listeria monocytogenes]
MENYALSYIRRTEKLPRTRFFRFAMTLVISTLIATPFLVPHSVSAAQSTSTKGTASGVPSAYGKFVSIRITNSRNINV